MAGRINMDGYTGQDATRYKATIQETMRTLGLSEQAVRKRVRRGTLASEKGEDGRVYVYLSADQYATRDADGYADQYADRDAGDADAPRYADLLAAKDAQLEDMRERVESLERSLDSEREANRENRRIIAGLTQRIPELESPSDRGDSNDAGDESHEGPPQRHEPPEEGYTSTETATEPHSSSQERPEVKRSWWRRLFGG